MTLPVKLAAKIRSATLAEFKRAGRGRFRAVKIARRFQGQAGRATIYRHVAAVINAHAARRADELEETRAVRSPGFVETLKRLVADGPWMDTLEAMPGPDHDRDARLLLAARREQTKILLLAADLIKVIEEREAAVARMVKAFANPCDGGKIVGRSCDDAMRQAEYDPERAGLREAVHVDA